MSSASAHGWTRSRLPGRGEPIEQRYISGGSQNEIYELRRGDLHCAMRIPPTSAPATRDDGIVREWRIIEALDGTDVPHTRSGRAVHRPLGAGSHLLPDGFRRRLVADGAHRRLAGPVRHRPRGAQGSRVPTGRRHRAAVEGRLAGQGPRTTSAVPTASTSARSTAGPRSWSASKAASCPASTRPRRGCAHTARSTSSRGSCTATTSSPT